jgi:putative PIG3 family NAD(P)H quinone oxidoreductase
MSVHGEMTAIVATRPGGPEVLSVVRRPIPEPRSGEVLIEVAAAGVNRVDVLQRLGRYTPPAGTTDILGVEAADTVAALGSGASRFEIGDRVCGLVIGGGYAEYCCVPEGQTLPLPAGLSFVQGAGLPETFITTWTALFDHGRLEAGESILIHGGSSGIGTTAIMLARMTGASAIFVTAGSPEKCRACESLGANRAINYRTEDFAAVVREATGGRGVDVIMDMVAADYVPRNMSLLADDGRLVFVGRMGPLVDSPINPTPIMFKRLTITGLSLRGQSIERKSAIARAVERTAWPWLAGGKIAPVIDRTYPLASAAEAHRRLKTSAHIGKLILDVGA